MRLLFWCWVALSGGLVAAGPAWGDGGLLSPSGIESSFLPKSTHGRQGGRRARKRVRRPSPPHARHHEEAQGGEKKRGGGEGINAFSWGIDESVLDPQVSACDDFYQHACGGWLAKEEIPSDLASWDRSFMQLRQNTKEKLRDLLTANHSPQAASSTHLQKIKTFYTSCMDASLIEKRGIAPVLEQFAAIQAVDWTERTHFAESFTRVLADLHLRGVFAFFNVGEQQDMKDATQMIAGLDQGGLSLPDRDYYALNSNDPKIREIQGLAKKWMTQLFTLLGAAAPEETADRIWRVETQLAQLSMSRTERRELEKIYHPVDQARLQEWLPSVNWEQYARRVLGVVGVFPKVNVMHPEFFSGLQKLLVVLSAQDIKSYLEWQVLLVALPALPQAFLDTQFNFQSQAFTGQKKMEVRWKRCVGAVQEHLPFAVGRAYIEATPGAQQTRGVAHEMIQAIEQAFDDNQRHLAWMDDASHAAAEKKRAAVVNQVSYPQEWKSYDALKLEPHSYLDNLFLANTFNLRDHLRRIGQPVNREEWEMSPADVNAYYDPAMNKMVFPAGILQVPFFHVQADPSFNYGGMGMVMGHELTHGFDDQGRRFNETGNWVDSWSSQVAQNFAKKSECVVQLYGKFQPLPGVFLNGQLTLGENLADLGGLRLAYQAFQKTQKPKSDTGLLEKKPGGSLQPVTNGDRHPPTEDQKFFLSFAQSWCTKKQDALSRVLAKVDPHSPPRFRVNGSVSQFEAFAESFHCQEGTPMAPRERCRVW